MIYHLVCITCTFRCVPVIIYVTRNKEDWSNTGVFRKCNHFLDDKKLIDIMNTINWLKVHCIYTCIHVWCAIIIYNVHLHFLPVYFVQLFKLILYNYIFALYTTVIAQWANNDMLRNDSNHNIHNYKLYWINLIHLFNYLVTENKKSPWWSPIVLCLEINLYIYM